MSCPFYGRALFAHMVLPVRFVLLDTKGNQCGIVTDAHSPCMMETNGEAVVWEECPRMKELRMERE